MIPALIVVKVLLPGTLGAIKQSFLPAGGLVAEQESSAGASGSGRLADLGPALDAWVLKPLTGQGFATMPVIHPGAALETNILDDQWLDDAAHVGVIGFVGWLWFFIRAVRRFGSAARQDDSQRGWLLTALTAGIAAYGVGMLTYDAFAFIQVTFLLFIYVSIGSAVLRLHPAPLVALAPEIEPAAPPPRSAPITAPP